MPEPRRPRVSVVIPCFNRGHLLDDAVSSCREAYGGPLEVVVVDDGSTDPRTQQHLDALPALPATDLQVVRQANAGPARARNVGLARCTGEYVQFLDSDDLLYRNKIEHQLSHLTLDPETDVSISDYHLCDETRSSFTRPPPSISSHPLTLDSFLYQWERGLSIPIHAALFRRSALRGPSPWPEVVRGKEDWLFWISLKLRGVRLGYLPLRLCAYRMHGENMTRDWDAMSQDFMKAARQIDAWLGGSHPDFMERCRRWAAEFYPASAAEEGATRRSASVPPAPPPRGPPVPEPSPPARSSAGAADRAAAGRVSIVIPVFNHAAHLRRCIRSAHLQTLSAREIVCVDDASTDPEVRTVLESLAAEIPELRLRFLDRNRGIAAAQNLAVDMASGDFVAFLDCDDFLPAGAVEAVAAAITAHPGCDYFFTDRYEVDTENRLLRRAVYGGYPNRPDLDRRSHRENLLDTMVASHLKVVRRSAILAAGGFDERTSGVQDWDLALKIAERGSLHYIPEPLYYHRVHSASVTLGQRVRMFRLTNEVRRRHQAVRAGKSAASSPSAAARGAVAGLAALSLAEEKGGAGFEWDPALRAWTSAEHGLAVVRAPRPFAQAFLLWSRTANAVFLLAPDAPRATLEFLREFNSYFDLVVCAHEAQWATLHRYMWDARALRLTGELDEGSARPRSAGAPGDQGASS